MNSIWDKVRDGIDRANKAAQDVIDEGKLRVDAYRAREAADKAAEAMGYGIFRAAEAGLELEPATRDRLFGALRERDTEARRLEAAIEAVKAGTPPHDAAGSSASGQATPSGTAYSDATSESGHATTDPNRAETTPPPGVDPTGTSGQGGS